MNWRDRFSKFMYGRYGADQFSKFLLGLTIALCIISLFVPRRLGSLFSTLIHFYKCPGCGQRIRIPKGHGKIQIRCPKCNATFIRRS